MGFSNRLRTSWGILKATSKLIGQDKEILIYPLLSGIIILLVVGSLLIIKFAGGVGLLLTGSDESIINAYSISLSFIIYLVSYFILSFFKVAIIDTAVNRMVGNSPTFTSSVKTSFRNISKIFLWSITAATFGLLMNILRKSNRMGSNVIRRILGISWKVVTYFVLPISVYEKRGVFSSMKRTVELLKGSWAEALIVNGSPGLIFFIGSFLSISLTIIGIIFIPLPISLFITFGIVSLVGLGSISSVFSGVLVSVLYVYSKTGTLPNEYSSFVERSHVVQAT